MELCHSTRIEYYLQVYMLESDRNHAEAFNKIKFQYSFLCTNKRARARSSTIIFYKIGVCALFTNIKQFTT